MSSDPTLEQIARGNGLALHAAGSWTAGFAPRLELMVAAAEKLAGTRPDISIDVSQVSKLDTFGAWLIERLRRSLTQGGVEAKIAGLSANYSSLVDEVRRVKASPAPRPAQPGRAVNQARSSVSQSPSRSPAAARSPASSSAPIW